ncbi:MAG TPA: DCC1-like thiol-disulfide oxidoreductase family protein [Chloroflexota bacterium]|nr:DCC1-like thiol-disulfide oxidoreductase family protein [Chloroflexota bacterium]
MKSEARTGADVRLPIVFFDGECGLCNGTVDVLLAVDRRAVLHFAPLQGVTARELLPPLPPDEATWSIVYLDERGAFERADAVIEICRRLGGVFALAVVGRALPVPLRDGIYRAIARGRYRLFGRRATCRAPSEREHARFLE